MPEFRKTFRRSSVGAAACPAHTNFIRRTGEAKSLLPGEKVSRQRRDGCGVHHLFGRFRNSYRVPSTPVTACDVPPSVSRRGLFRTSGGAKSFHSRGRLWTVQTVSPYRPSSVMADAMPLRNGMTATGSHEYFYSLRGAQPPGEGFSQSGQGPTSNSGHSPSHGQARDSPLL